MAYLRFTILQHDPNSHQPQGLFAAAYALLEKGEMTSEERQQVEEVLVWFKKNLPIPGEKWGSHQRRVTFWFRPTASECIRRMWELAEILRQHGCLIELHKRTTLGNPVYWDKYQVAAYPSDKDE